MEKFSEYLASFITPQMTLLEKFNAMCKYLNELEQNFGTSLFKHKFVLSNGKEITFINNVSEKYNDNYVLTPNFMGRVQDNVMYGNDLIIKIGYAGAPVLVYVDHLLNIASDTLSGLSVVSQDIEKL